MSLPMHIIGFKYIELLKKIYFVKSFVLIQKVNQANSAEPDQTPRYAASDLVRHCFPMFHKKDTIKA